jgi:ketosteroid isomerase-like protein
VIGKPHVPLPDPNAPTSEIPRKKEKSMKFSSPLGPIVITLAFALSLSSAAAAGEDHGAADPASDLRETEEAFAKTMADRDHEGFVSFLADETVFFGQNGEIRGKSAVAAAWKPFYEGAQAPFSWTPESATVLDSGGLGLTSGPVFTPDGKRVGTFNSVWRRDGNGQWKVVFDRGCPPCKCPPAGDDGE